MTNSEIAILKEELDKCVAHIQVNRAVLIDMIAISELTTPIRERLEEYAENSLRLSNILKEEEDRTSQAHSKLQRLKWESAGLFLNLLHEKGEEQP